MIQMGIYRHYKGPLYQVLGLAHDANNEGRTLVLYIGLELNKAHPGPRLAVRDIEDFTARVYQDQLEYSVDRFFYLGPEFNAGMLR